MPLSDQVSEALGQGAAWSFSDRPNPDVPTFGAGVRPVWHLHHSPRRTIRACAPYALVSALLCSEMEIINTIGGL